MAQRIFNTYRQAFTGLPREIWLLSLIMLINRAGTMVIIFFVLYLTKVFEFSSQTAGLIISSSAVGGMLGAFFGGWFSDRFGSIRAQIIFLSLVGIQFFALLLAQSLASISIMLFVLMFLGEAVRPGLHASCFDYCEPAIQKRAFGLLRMAVNLGMAIGPVIGGILAELDLWNWLFVLDGFTCALSAILLYAVFGWGKAKQPKSSETSKPSEAATSPWRDRKMLGFGALYLLVLIVFIQFASTFVMYLKDVHGLSESRIGMIGAINPILIVLVEMVIIQAIERYSTIKTIAVGGLLICLGFGSLPLSPTGYFCIVSVVILTLGEILAFPMTAAYAAELSNDSNRGQYMGFITVMFSLAMIIGPVLGLSLYEIDRNLPWYASLAVGVATFALMWRIKPSDRCHAVTGTLGSLEDQNALPMDDSQQVQLNQRTEEPIQSTGYSSSSIKCNPSS